MWDLPPYSIRSTGLEREGDGAPDIRFAGLHDDSELGMFRTDNEVSANSFKHIFGGEWKPEERLVSGDRRVGRLNGMRIELRLEPGERLNGRLLVVR